MQPMSPRKAMLGWVMRAAAVKPIGEPTDVGVRDELRQEHFHRH